MGSWSVHNFHADAREALGDELAADLSAYAAKLAGRSLAPLLTLGHLAASAGVDLPLLVETVNRRRESANYKMYAIRKRSGGRRFIHSVCSDLMMVHKYVNQAILQHIKPHDASYAYHPDGGVRRCAQRHCGCRWMLQFDLKDFFWSVNELDAFAVFVNAGYTRLLSFELARICTTTRLPITHRQLLTPRKCAADWLVSAETVRPYYDASTGNKLGVLPQGAPTSPMISNIAAIGMDVELSKHAASHGLTYTRYADDLTFSTPGSFDEGSIGKHIASIRSVIRSCGFVLNEEKTRISRPGSRKELLGMLVDGMSVRVSKQMKKRIDHLLYGARKHGTVKAAAHEGFESSVGFYNHLSGLMSYLKDVDPEHHACILSVFMEIGKPLE